MNNTTKFFVFICFISTYNTAWSMATVEAVSEKLGNLQDKLVALSDQLQTLKESGLNLLTAEINKLLKKTSVGGSKISGDGGESKGQELSEEPNNGKSDNPSGNSGHVSNAGASNLTKPSKKQSKGSSNATPQVENQTILEYLKTIKEVQKEVQSVLENVFPNQDDDFYRNAKNLLVEGTKKTAERYFTTKNSDLFTKLTTGTMPDEHKIKTNGGKKLSSAQTAVLGNIQIGGKPSGQKTVTTQPSNPAQTSNGDSENSKPTPGKLQGNAGSGLGALFGAKKPSAPSTDLSSYAKKQKLGIPEPAIRKQMSEAGINQDAIDAFFATPQPNTSTPEPIQSVTPTPTISSPAIDLSEYDNLPNMVAKMRLQGAGIDDATIANYLATRGTVSATPKPTLNLGSAALKKVGEHQTSQPSAPEKAQTLDLKNMASVFAARSEVMKKDRELKAQGKDPKIVRAAEQLALEIRQLETELTRQETAFNDVLKNLEPNEKSKQHLYTRAKKPSDYTFPKIVGKDIKDFTQDDIKSFKYYKEGSTSYLQRNDTNTWVALEQIYTDHKLDEKHLAVHRLNACQEWNAIAEVIDRLQWAIEENPVLKLLIIQKILPSFHCNYDIQPLNILFLQNGYREPTYLRLITASVLYYRGYSSLVYKTLADVCLYELVNIIQTVNDPEVLTQIEAECLDYLPRNLEANDVTTTTQRNRYTGQKVLQKMVAVGFEVSGCNGKTVALGGTVAFSDEGWEARDILLNAIKLRKEHDATKKQREETEAKLRKGFAEDAEETITAIRSIEQEIKDLQNSIAQWDGQDKTEQKKQLMTLCQKLVNLKRISNQQKDPIESTLAQAYVRNSKNGVAQYSTDSTIENESKLTLLGNVLREFVSCNNAVKKNNNAAATDATNSYTELLSHLGKAITKVFTSTPSLKAISQWINKPGQDAFITNLMRAIEFLANNQAEFIQAFPTLYWANDYTPEIAKTLVLDSINTDNMSELNKKLVYLKNYLLIRANLLSDDLATYCTHLPKNETTGFASEMIETTNDYFREVNELYTKIMQEIGG